MISSAKAFPTRVTTSFLVASLIMLCHGKATCAASNNSAEPDQFIADDSSFHKWGLSSASQISSKSCREEFRIDQPTFQSQTEDMAGKIFNERVSVATGNVAPHMLMRTFMSEASPGLVKQFFETFSDIDKCTFKWFIINPDEFGNDKSTNPVTFIFNRATYDKINWERFNSDNLRKVASSYHIDPSFESEAADEAVAAMSTMKSDH